MLHFFINYDPSWLGEFGLKPVFSIGSVVDLYSNIDRELILSKREDLEGTKGLDENALYHLRDALTKIRSITKPKTNNVRVLMVRFVRK